MGTDGRYPGYEKEAKEYRNMRTVVAHDFIPGARKIPCDWTTFESFMVDLGKMKSPDHILKFRDPELGYRKTNIYWGKPYRNQTHGMSGTMTFKIWLRLRSRCTDPSNLLYLKYGNKLCPRWEEFRYFFWDVGHPPLEGGRLTLIDKKGKYEPNNVRWT